MLNLHKFTDEELLAERENYRRKIIYYCMMLSKIDEVLGNGQA